MTPAAAQRHSAWALRLALATITGNDDACYETLTEIEAADGCWRSIAGALNATLRLALEESHGEQAALWVERGLVGLLDEREAA